MAEPKLKKSRPTAAPGLVGDGKRANLSERHRVGRATKSAATKSVVEPPVKMPRRPRAHGSEEKKSSMLHIRLEDTLKEDVTKTLDQIGISMPEAIRVFLKRIVREQAFPFRLEVPNSETALALRESLATTDRRKYTSKEGMFDELEGGGVG